MRANVSFEYLKQNIIVDITPHCHHPLAAAAVSVFVLEIVFKQLIPYVT